VQVLVLTQRPDGVPAGEVILVHGLEGSSDAGYMRSIAQALLESGFVVHRMNLRSCGGTEFLCKTFYHAGLTTDVMALLLELDRQRRTPVFLVGFSLGGNIVLKLAGEMGADARRLLAGVCTLSTPLDLLKCALALHQPAGRPYEWAFLVSMKRRLRLRHHAMPACFPIDGLERVGSMYDFDDRFTAPGFGFRGADHYYDTQSARRFLDLIRVPTLVIQAKDDPMIPFTAFDHPAFTLNSHLRLVAVEHGGHLGFVSRRPPRFWSDGVVTDWIREVAAGAE